MRKTCFKCGRKKPIGDFYAHPRMKDGVLGKCKACTRADVKANREANRDRVAEYERCRFQNPERKRKVAEYQRRRRAKYPEKERARQKVEYAVASGKLAKGSCAVCGSPDTQAHHDDYSRPLDVVWLCFKHHREAGHGQKTNG